MANFAQFATFPIFSHQSSSFHQISKFLFHRGVHQPIFPDLQLLKSFSTKAAQNDPQWPILSPKWLGLVQNGQFWSISHFPIFSHKKWPRLTQNGQFCPICNLSNLFPPKWLIFCQISKFSFLRGGVHQPIFPDFQLFKLFPTEATQNDPQWPIFPPKWLRLAQNCQFW